METLVQLAVPFFIAAARNAADGGDAIRMQGFRRRLGLMVSGVGFRE